MSEFDLDKAVVEFINRYSTIESSWVDHSLAAKAYREAFAKARELFEPKWISVDERLPKHQTGEYFLLRIKDKDKTMIGFWGGYHFQIGKTQPPVTHWQPLPTPPTEGES